MSKSENDMNETERANYIKQVATAAETTDENIIRAIKEQAEEFGLEFDYILITHYQFTQKFPGLMKEIKKMVMKRN